MPPKNSARPTSFCLVAMGSNLKTCAWWVLEEQGKLG